MKEYPDFLVEQLFLDELPKKKKREGLDIENLKEEIDSIKYSNKELLEKFPPEIIAHQIKNKIKKSKSNKISFFHSFRLPIITAAAALIFFIFLIPGIINNQSSTSNNEIIYLKGSDALIKIHKKANSKSEILKDGSIVKENDKLQLSYLAGEYKYGTIISIDGNNTVSLHYPDFEYESTMLNTEGENLLNYSYILDSAPDYEVFYFIASNNEFKASQIIKTANELIKSDMNPIYNYLNLPDDFKQSRIILFKE